MIGTTVSTPGSRPVRPARAETRELAELRVLRQEHPELADAVDMHAELVELHRRIQPRVPLPSFELNAGVLARHQASGQPLLRFEDIPLDLTDLRLMVRQTADVLRRFGALDDGDYRRVQTLGRDMALLNVTSRWYRSQAAQAAAGAAALAAVEDDLGMLAQVLTLAMRPFLARCAEVLQQRPELASWTHAHCPLCGAEPELAVITPAAERNLLCSRCTLQWRFAPLTCPFCLNADRARITSFATTDGRYRVYACDACKRYLKAYDGRRSGARPAMPLVDAVATLPLDAAAMQRGYTS